MNGSLELRIAGEMLLLLPERGVYWQRERMLIIADTHFGKSSVFGMHGVPVPAGADEQDRRRIERLMFETGAEHLLVLGDFLHAPLADDNVDARALIEWRAVLGPGRLHVVAGNHDRGTLRNWRAAFDWHDGDWVVGPFCFAHDAGNAQRAGGFTLSGHIHPVTRLRGLRKLGARVPVFWLRPHGLVLPSFGLFTGGHAVRPADEDRLFAVTPERVMAFGRGGPRVPD